MKERAVSSWNSGLCDLHLFKISLRQNPPILWAQQVEVHSDDKQLRSKTQKVLTSYENVNCAMEGSGLSFNHEFSQLDFLMYREAIVPVDPQHDRKIEHI